MQALTIYAVCAYVPDILLPVKHTFINLPPALEQAVTNVLGNSDSKNVIRHAKILHERYMAPERSAKTPLVRSGRDILAYLSLRFPATYAQIASALFQVKERLPGWTPKTMLDLGCGPGTGLFAAHAVWPGISTATAVDREDAFLAIGKLLTRDTGLPMDITWNEQSVSGWAASKDHQPYDLIIVANVINELPAPLIHEVLQALTTMKDSVVLILEPGTSHGFRMIQSAAEKVAKYKPLVAPYINNSLIQSQEYWIHFPQRFIRPEFQRTVRNTMRDSHLMASDWEEAKYSFVAFGEANSPVHPHAVCIGSAELHHGYLTVPLLTEHAIDTVKVMKRHKQQYRFAKNLAWGDTVESADLVRINT